MQLKWVAIDDEPLALDLIKAYASRVPVLKMVQVFDDPIAGAEFLRKNPVDLLFLDINMPDITGIDLLKSFEEKPATIFTTAYKKFAYEGYELDAIDYLLKPIDFDRFSKAVNKAVEYYSYKRSSKPVGEAVIFVRSEYQLIKIELEQIEYIESVEDYLKIHLATGYPVMTLMTLKAILEKLPPEKFMRVHRSYVVPLSKIKSFLNRKVKLTTAEIPVSDTYIDELRNLLKK
jgi:DNA-binding LytR/AlgR family response regulator